MVNPKLEELLDEIQAKYPALTNDHRIYLSSIARGYRVMLQHGGVYGAPSPLNDVWICANHHFADACNSVQRVVGVEAEASITRRIRGLEETRGGLIKFT